MKKITLLFPSTQELLLFKETTHANYIDINEEEKILVCECSQTDVRLAIKKYNAKVIATCNDELKQNA